MNKSERLAQFLEWSQGKDTSLTAADLRLLAVALLDESGGGRVNESHILAASDRHAGVGGEDAVAKVHTVGELFLAFEEEARVPKRSSRNLQVSFASDVSARDPAPIAPPADAEEDVVAVAAAGEAAKRAGTDKPAAATPSAGMFRCPTCATFVNADARGKCPKCGNRPPRQVKMPSKWRPTKGQGHSNVLPILGIGVLLIGGSVLGMRWLSRSMEASSGAPVTGPHAVGSLDLQVVFPAGWRQAQSPRGSAELVPGVRGRLASFYRGGTPSEPDNLLVFAGARREDAEVPDDAELRELAAQVASSAGSSLRRETTFDPADCAVIEVGVRRVARCPGEAPGERSAVVYAWAEGDHLLAAYAVGRGEREQLIALADEVVSTAEIVEPPAPPPQDPPAAEEAEGEEAAAEEAAPDEVPPP